LTQEITDLAHEAITFVEHGKGVGSVDDALAGARDIMPNGQ